MTWVAECNRPLQPGVDKFPVAELGGASMSRARLAAPLTEAQRREQETKDFWSSYVKNTHQRTRVQAPPLPKLRTVHSEPALQHYRRPKGVARPLEVGNPAQPWMKYGLTSKPSASNLALPPIHKVDVYSKVALLQSEAEGEARAMFANPDPVLYTSPKSVMSKMSPTRAATLLKSPQSVMDTTSPVRKAQKSFTASAMLPPPPDTTTAAEKAAKAKRSQVVGQATDVINAKFSNMFKAFQYIDLDHSGTLSKDEIVRAFDLFNIQVRAW